MKPMTQLALIFGLSLLGEAVSGFLPFPFPGTVISMILLFALFASRLLPVARIRPAAEFLTKNMAFFLIPPGVGILSSLDILKKNLLPFLVIVSVSTVLAFAAAAWTVQLAIALQKRLESSEARGEKK